MKKKLFSKFIKMSWNKKLLATKVLFFSLIIRLIILIIPFKYISKHIGIKNVESTYNPTFEELKWLKNVAKTIEKVCLNTPWESKCLVQALIGQKLLYKRGIGSTLFFGVAKDTDNKLIAHAWLKCGDFYVTGFNNVSFGVVAKYMK